MRNRENKKNFVWKTPADVALFYTASSLLRPKSELVQKTIHECSLPIGGAHKVGKRLKLPPRSQFNSSGRYPRSYRFG